jgi:hypothetical protein
MKVMYVSCKANANHSRLSGSQQRVSIGNGMQRSPHVRGDEDVVPKDPQGKTQAQLARVKLLRQASDIVPVSPSVTADRPADGLERALEELRGHWSGRRKERVKGIDVVVVDVVVIVARVAVVVVGAIVVVRRDLGHVLVVQMIAGGLAVVVFA